MIVLALGSNSGGQLATGDMEDAHQLTPCIFKEPPGDDEAVEWTLCGGGNHVFLWSSSGTRLLACGANGDGELGMVESSNSTVLEWTPARLPGEDVKQVACGWNHSLLLDSHGNMYATGANSFHQLGAGLSKSSLARSRSWVAIGPELPISFVSVACGMRHSLALSSDGSVFGWGANRCGQLGLVPDKKNPNISAVTRVSDGLPPITMVACGRGHSILVSEDRVTVFVAGQDKYSQCGPAGAQPIVGTWRSFQLPRRAKKVCSGWDFGAVLLEPAAAPAGNNVVMWGRADHGQLAGSIAGGRSSELVEVPLPDVCDLACGSNHATALTSGGAAYMWGWNEHGNAGDPSLHDVYEPRRAVAGGPVDGVGCGFGNSYLIKLRSA
ncbi:alpha tubulin suppressor [Coemansia sp. RSA 552]|nr:alpha tubulin suppressor [Coemansia sp. RSA 552]